jgi:uncharacterized protein
MRTCGDCTMCCKLLGVVELAKPRDQWCPNCHIGRGCNIYDSRPRSCRDFGCMWLLYEDMPEEARPDRSHVVIWEPEANTERIIQINVDPARPDAWKAPVLRKLIQLFTNQGVDVFLLTGQKRLAFTSSPERAAVYRRMEIPTI